MSHTHHQAASESSAPRPRYVRLTRDEWEIQQLTGYGWELETTEVTRAAAVANLRIYRANCPGCTFRVVKRRVRIHQGAAS